MGSEIYPPAFAWELSTSGPGGPEFRPGLDCRVGDQLKTPDYRILSLPLQWAGGCLIPCGSSEPAVGYTIQLALRDV